MHQRYQLSIFYLHSTCRNGGIFKKNVRQEGKKCAMVCVTIDKHTRGIWSKIWGEEPMHEPGLAQYCRMIWCNSAAELEGLGRQWSCSHLQCLQGKQLQCRSSPTPPCPAKPHSLKPAWYVQGQRFYHCSLKIKVLQAKFSSNTHFFFMTNSRICGKTPLFIWSHAVLIIWHPQSYLCCFMPTLKARTQPPLKSTWYMFVLMHFP